MEQSLFTLWRPSMQARNKTEMHAFTDHPVKCVRYVLVKKSKTSQPAYTKESLKNYFFVSGKFT